MGEREINHIATGMSPQPRGRLLPLHHGDGGDVVGGDGDHPGSATPEFPPSNLQLLISVSVFLCLRPTPSGKLQGTIYAVGFRSRRNQGDEDRRHQSHKGERGWSHAARYRGRVGPSISLLVGLLVFNFSPLRSPQKF